MLRTGVSAIVVHAGSYTCSSRLDIWQLRKVPLPVRDFGASNRCSSLEIKDVDHLRQHRAVALGNTTALPPQPTLSQRRPPSLEAKSTHLR